MAIVVACFAELYCDYQSQSKQLVIPLIAYECIQGNQQALRRMTRVVLFSALIFGIVDFFPQDARRLERHNTPGIEG